MPPNAPEPGCYLDSHRGHYAIPAVIRLAEDYGRKLDAEMSELLARYDAHSHEPEYPNELIIEESDAAIQWLNDHVQPDGYWWGWNDGDFGLYPLDTEEEAHPDHRYNPAPFCAKCGGPCEMKED